MTTLQEQFEKDFPDKSARVIDVDYKYRSSNFTNWDLDLKEYVNLEELKLGSNNLTTVDFLNTIPNPEKLEILHLYDNNVQPSTLDFLRPFVNLKRCLLGENIVSIIGFKTSEILEERLKNKVYNKFYGSIEPIKNLTKLEEFCIAGTDVEEGIEYIANSILTKQREIFSEMKIEKEDYEKFIEGLKKIVNRKFYENLEEYKSVYSARYEVLKNKGIADEAILANLNSSLETKKKYAQEQLEENATYGEWLEKKLTKDILRKNLIDCQPLRSDAKVAKIQNELRFFNYDIEAWQLAHPEKMLIVRPELFANPESKEKWLIALNNKIQETRTELEQVKTQEADKTAKITRLETKLQRLEETKTRLETELAQEKQSHNTTKQNHSHQLKELAIIISPSNSDIDNLSFTDLKKQAEKVKQENKEKIKNLENQLFLKEVEIDNLKESQVQLEQKLVEISQQSMEKELQTKQKELENLKNSLKVKLDENLQEELDDLLEAQIEFSKNNNTYVKKQLIKIKKKLTEKSNLTEQELVNICEIQSKLAKLEREIYKLKEQETQVQIAPK